MKIRSKQASILFTAMFVLTAFWLSVPRARAQTAFNGTIAPYTDPDSTIVYPQDSSPQTYGVPGTVSENSQTYGSGGANPPKLQVTISQLDQYFTTLPTQTPDTVYFSGKIKYTASPQKPLSIYWNCAFGPTDPVFSNPDPTSSPYGTNISLSQGGTYKLKLHATDGTLSDTDSIKV